MINKENKEKFREKMALLKLKIKSRKRKNLVVPVTPPRYDDVFYEGVEWLNKPKGDL